MQRALGALDERFSVTTNSDWSWEQDPGTEWFVSGEPSPQDPTVFEQNDGSFFNDELAGFIFLQGH